MILSLILPMTFVVNADEVPDVPSIDEIVAAYYEKSLANLDDGVASYSMGQGDLEEETVQILNDAGYEAYYVESSNFEEISRTLNTDLFECGMLEDESYIVIVTGENEEPSTCGITDPNASEDNFGSGAGSGGNGNYFTYSYAGVAYSMRYLTVVPSSDSRLRIASVCDLTERINATSLDYILSAFYKCYMGIVPAFVPGSGFLSFLGTIGDELTIAYANDLTVTLLCNTSWTRSCIQVYSEEDRAWYTRQFSASATSNASCAIQEFNADIEDYDTVIKAKQTEVTKSPYYDDLSQRKINAVKAYLNGSISADYTGDICFIFVDEKNEIIINGDDKPLFSHAECKELID